MLFNTLLSLGAVVLTMAMFLGLLYYSLFTASAKFSAIATHVSQHEPLLDDEMAYLVFSMYPYHEYVHFPAMPMNLGQADATQPPQAYNNFPALPFTVERQDAPQLV